MDNRLLELISPWRWMPRMLGMPGLPRSSGQVCRAMPKVSEQCRPRCQSGIPANTPPPDSPPPVAVVTEPNGIKCKWWLKFFKLSGQHSTCFHCGTFAIKKIKIHTKLREEDGPRCTYLSLRPIADGAIYRYRVPSPRLPLSFVRIWRGF